MFYFLNGKEVRSFREDVLRRTLDTDVQWTTCSKGLADNTDGLLLSSYFMLFEFIWDHQSMLVAPLEMMVSSLKCRFLGMVGRMLCLWTTLFKSRASQQTVQN